MSRYETITNLGEEFISLMGKGIIPVHLLDWKVYYEAYKVEMEKLSKQYGRAKKNEAIEIVAVNYDVSRRNMYYIIAFMEGA